MRKRSLFSFFFPSSFTEQQHLCNQSKQKTLQTTPPDGPRMTATDANFSRNTKWDLFRPPSAPVNQSKRCAAYLATKHQRQSVVGAGNFAVAQQRGAIRAFHYGRHSRDQKEWGGKKGWKDRLCCRANSVEEDKQLKSHPASESFKEDSRFTGERDCVRASAHTCRGTQSTPPAPSSYPPPHPPPSALTNSHCLYLSFPSVPTINCPFRGGINSLPRTSVTCPPNVANTEEGKPPKRRNTGKLLQ